MLSLSATLLPIFSSTVTEGRLLLVELKKCCFAAQSTGFSGCVARASLLLQTLPREVEGEQEMDAHDIPGVPWLLRAGERESEGQGSSGDPQILQQREGTQIRIMSDQSVD